MLIAFALWATEVWMHTVIHGTPNRKAATECERSARHDEVALPRLQCRRLGTEPDAGYIVWQPNKIQPPQPAAAVAVGGCTLQVIVCHTVREWDKPSDRVTLGVMNLGEEIRFSDGFLEKAQAAIKTVLATDVDVSASLGLGMGAWGREVE